MPGLSDQDLYHMITTLESVRENPEILQWVDESTTSCIKWSSVLKDLMKEQTIDNIFIRQHGKTVSAADFSNVAAKLKAGNAVIVVVKLPGSTNHAFTIDPSGGGSARVLHGWQDQHRLRAEEVMAIDDIVEHLKALSTLDWVSDKAQVVAERRALWGSDHADYDDITTSSRRKVSFDQILSGEPKEPLMSPRSRSRLGSLTSSMSEWHTPRSSRSGSTASFVTAMEEHSGSPVRTISIRWSAAAGSAVGFVFSAGGALLVGVIRGDKIDYQEIILQGTKGALAGAAGGAAEAAVVRSVTPGFARIGQSVVRANAAAGVAVFGVLAIWDVTEWAMDKKTTVELRQSLAASAGGAAGGILGGVGAGAAGGLAFGPVGVVIGGIIGGVAGGIGGSFAGTAIDNAIWDETEDNIMNTYEFFGWRVSRETRPLYSAVEIREAYKKTHGDKPENVKQDDWDKICTGKMMVLLKAMYPEFQSMLQSADRLRQSKGKALSAIATSFHHFFEEDN